LRAKAAVILHLDDRLASLQPPPFRAGSFTCHLAKRPYNVKKRNIIKQIDDEKDPKITRSHPAK
jgi:hypothetical protein